MNPQSGNVAIVFDGVCELNDRDYEDILDFDKFCYAIRLKSIITIGAFVQVNLDIDSEINDSVLYRVIDIVDDVHNIPLQERQCITHESFAPYLKLQIYLKLDAEAAQYFNILMSTEEEMTEVYQTESFVWAPYSRDITNICFIFK